MALFKKEKAVDELILKHLDMVEDCVKTSRKAGEFYLQDDISQAKVHARSSQSLESQADLIRHDIRDKLYSGAYLPLLREDIYKLVESID
ncbi:MAG: DUF47 family protein, partial [Gammaproteobacteria bacterium]|nr:DUF47 family protein [Gammaproteobacteria bacterium]